MDVNVGSELSTGTTNSFWSKPLINNSRTGGATPMMGMASMAQGMTTTLSSMYAFNKEAGMGKANASSFYRQSMLYERQGDYLMQSARSTASIAPKFVELGKANARNSRIRAGQVQYFIDASQSEVVKEAQQKVGEGLASFAANGVMIESRDGAAVAMWEQDEAADASYQQLIIAQKGQDTIWEYLMEAQQKEAEGYAQAAQAYSRASEIAGGAYTGYLQSYEANRAGDAAAKAARKAKRSMMGSGIGAAVGAVVAVGAAWATGGASLAAYGMLAGTGAGMGSTLGGSSSSW